MDSSFIPPVAFRPVNNEVSVDWEKYTSAELILSRARVPDENGVIVLNVIDIRDNDILDVVHAPIPENQAHSNIIGFKDLPKSRITKLRLQLALKGKWKIHPRNIK